MKHKMIQVLYPSNQGWTEIFFDGEVKVVDNIVEFDHDHWRDILFTRGFTDYVEEEAAQEEETPEPAPQEEVVEETPTATKNKRSTRKATSKSARYYTVAYIGNITYKERNMANEKNLIGSPDHVETSDERLAAVEEAMRTAAALV